MEIWKTKVRAEGIKIFIQKDGLRIGRATLYLMTNDLNNRPFGLLEDLFVDEQFSSRGIGTKLVKAVIEEAKVQGCYKLIATSRYSRPEVHKFYLRFGFKDYGKEFRIDFD